MTLYKGAKLVMVDSVTDHSFIHYLYEVVEITDFSGDLVVKLNVVS